MNSSGKVTLVGAGPGDADLITLKGLNALLEADVVVHDRLVSRQLLDRIPTQTMQIDVGKRPNHHPFPQSSIIRKLIQLAETGRHVVRLKGGDPFVFGRGYEELLECRQRGIRCEVIPGISSSVAGPASAGVPVTLRGIARSFAVITAESGSEFDDPDHDFEALSKIDTLVVLMGRRKMASVSARLIMAGSDPSTPVVCVERATLPNERVVRGTLANIAAIADRMQLSSPMVMVIGEVAQCHPAQSQVGSTNFSTELCHLAEQLAS